MTTGLSLYRSPAHTSSRSLLDVDRFFNEFHNSFFSGPRRSLGTALKSASVRRAFAPRVSLTEEGDQLQLVAEMPGVDAQDFEVLVEGDVLVVKGERKWASDRPEGVKAEGEEPEGERATTSGAFQRRFRISDEIATDQIAASYKNGVLTVTLPKRAEPEPVVRTIPVSHA